MRKFGTSIVLSSLLVLAAGAGAAHGGEATFKLTNEAPFNVMVKVFAKARNWQWPSHHTHWDLNDSARHEFRISCQDGEQVCYGGAYAANDATYWGVGFKGDKGCADCCLTCGNASHAWNLIKRPGTGRPLRPAGQPIDPGSVNIPATD